LLFIVHWGYQEWFQMTEHGKTVKNCTECGHSFLRGGLRYEPYAPPPTDWANFTPPPHW
jgi:hypothetical protein